jgi:hypothetical protein
MMNLQSAIKALRDESERLTKAIADLERIQEGAVPTTRRRGRKFMGTAERKEVAERMRRYWATRRNKAT